MSEIYQSNSYYQGLLQNLYGGAKGCFSLFMHFVYQYNQTKVFCEGRSGVFENVMKLELENCHILSRILINMGGDNKFCSSTKRFLSGQNIEYVKELKQVFSIDIEFLEVNILEVKSMILKIEDEKIRKVLKNILENKKQELKLLKVEFFKNNAN